MTVFFTYNMVCLDNALFRPTFGCPLDVHLRIKEREIALVLEECILFLLENAMDMQVDYITSFSFV